MHNFKELSVWKRAREPNKQIYLLTKTFPTYEQYSITSQIHRASTSIAANIAEWSGRNWHKEFIQFLSIANGSAFELETHIMLAHDLWYLTAQQFNEICLHIWEVEKMLHGLIRHNKSLLKNLVDQV